MHRVFVPCTLFVAFALVAVLLPAAPLAAQQCISCQTLIANSTPTTVTIVGTFPGNDCPWAKMDWEHQVDALCMYGFCLRQDGPSPGGCSPCGPSLCKWTQDVSYICEECIDTPSSTGGLKEVDPRVPALDNAICPAPKTPQTSALPS